MNIFQGGALRETINVQSALQEQALVQYESAVLGALEEVENALMALAKENERKESLALAVRAASQAAELSLQEYTAGLTDFQSVLETQQSLTSLQDNLASSQGNMTLNLISLYKSLGGGWSADDNQPTPEEGTDARGVTAQRGPTDRDTLVN
jgi:outer membrane protein TolC